MGGFLNNTNVIVTGAKGNIGKACVELFAENGANIWACARKYDSDFEETLKSIENKYGVWVKPIYFDLSNQEEIQSAIKSIISEKLPIDVLINNAGIVGENRLFHMTSINEMKRIFDVNFFGTMFITQLVSRAMIRRKKGAIINVASIAGIDGDPAQLEYSASKAAIISATIKLAKELGPFGIRVNSVAPGLTDTDMLQMMNQEVLEDMISRSVMKRCGTPTEIANSILYLASDLSSYVTGQTIRVDGGHF